MAISKELLELAVHAARNTAPANFSVENVNDALRGELSKIASSVNEFRRNRYDIYEIITTAIDEVVPARVIDALSAVADVRTVPQGARASFKVGTGKIRAKKFLTQVGVSGVYETFRLDTKNIDIKPHAIGGGATIDYERMLDGEENMADIMDVFTEGLTEAVFKEVQTALVAAFSSTERPAANKVEASGFDADSMFKLVSTVKAYGNGAVIVASPEFVGAMGADAIVPIPQSGNYQGVYSPDDIEAIHRTGYINLFRGTPVITLPQSFEDVDNTTKVINPAYAYVLPTGGEKPIKVVLEGQTQIKDHEAMDNAMEIYAWKKIGVGVLCQYNWGIYHNTELA